VCGDICCIACLDDVFCIVCFVILLYCVSVMYFVFYYLVMYSVLYVLLMWAGMVYPVMDYMTSGVEPPSFTYSYILRNATIWTGAGDILEAQDMWLFNGSVRQIGKSATRPDMCTEYGCLYVYMDARMRTGACMQICMFYIYACMLGVCVRGCMYVCMYV